MVEGQKQSGQGMVFPSQQPQGQQPPRAFTSMCKSRNSVFPDSGASADGKSLRKKRKESEFGGVGRKKLDQTQHLYH